MAKILIVEDHDSLRDALKSRLDAEGFQTLQAKDLVEAELRMSEAPELVILDWMLPDGQGLDFLRHLRKTGLSTPVIFLTARAETCDKVLGLELGASDYITKPFDSRELVARVRTRLRESKIHFQDHGTSDTLLKVGALVVDRIRRKVSFRERTVELVKKEYDLLILFAESPERVFSRNEILNKVWGYEVFPTTRTVDTHVMLLRQKIDDRLIETVRSVGYKFKPV